MSIPRSLPEVLDEECKLLDEISKHSNESDHKIYSILSDSLSRLERRYRHGARYEYFPGSPPVLIEYVSDDKDTTFNDLVSEFEEVADAYKDLEREIKHALITKKLQGTY